MKGFITIVAASAVLSASLCAGLAASDNGRILRTQTATASASIAPVSAAQAPAAQSAWIDPPAKADAACREAAWPYRAAQCATKDAASAAPARKVRVIPAAPAATLAKR